MKRIKIFFLIATFFSLCTTQAQCDLFFSEYAEGSSNNKYLEIFNPTNADISLDGYAFPSVSNAPTTPGVLEFWNTFTLGAVVPAGGFYIVSHGSADPSILALANQNHTYLSNGDDGFALVQGTETDFVVLDVICQNITDLDYADPGTGWAVAGVANATQDHVLVRKSSVINGNTDWALSAGTDEASSEWTVMPVDTWTDLGLHTFTGSCGPMVPGCMNENATNYDAAANEDDGSCTFANACNLEGTEVAASSFAFVPADLSVAVGTLVFWVNNGGTHNANGDLDTQTGLSFGNPESFGFASVPGDAA
jgi:plastocyanin